MAVRFKNSININDEYTLPTQDGTNGQALVTDGSGNISFSDLADAGTSINPTDNAIPLRSNATTFVDSIVSQGSGALSIDGELSMLNHKIKNVVNPTDAQDAATKNYVDTQGNTNYLPLAGGTMAGNINMNVNNRVTFGSSNDLKIYHAGGAQISNDTGLLNINSTSGVTIRHANNVKLATSTTGISVTGKATSTATVDADTATTLTTKGYVDTKNASYLPLAGGTMTGAIALPSDPTLALQAATKAYVDSNVAGSLVYQGGYNAITNSPDLTTGGTGVLQGWTYAVTAGPSTSFWSPPLNVGDLIIANVDNPTTVGDWTEVQSNIGFAGSGTTDANTTKGLAGFDSADFTVSNDGWVKAKDFIGTTPGYVPDATGAATGTFLKEDGTWAVAGTGTITGGGVPTRIPFFTGNSNLDSNANLSWDRFNNRLNIGPGYPAEKLYVNSASGDSRIGLNAPAGSDTEIKFSNAGVIQYTIGHDDATDNFVIGTANVDTPKVSITKAGNVGIGTTDPNVKLRIAGTQGNPATSGSTSTGFLSLYTGTHGLMMGVQDASPFGSWIQAQDKTNHATNYNLLLNPNGGNVGIGTVSPSNTTHIYKNATTGAITSPTVANAGLRIQDSGANMYFDGNSIILDNAGYLTTTGNNDFVIGTNTAPRITVQGGGNVGIGTTNPAQGNLVLSPSTQNGDLDGLVLAYNPDGAANRVRAKLYIDNYNGYLDLKSGGDTLTTRITSAGDSYFNNGNVGIGTNVPARNLHVHSAALTDIHLTNDDTGTTSTDGGTITMAALDLLINNRESGNTRFLVAGTERMRITSTGAVSFGSSGTSYGSSGKVLTSNGNTSPTWEDAAGGGVDTISVTGTGSSRVTTIADGLKLTGVESPGGAPQGGYALIGVSNGNDNVPEGTVVSFHDSDSSESEDPFSVSVRSNGDYFWNMHGKLTIEETDANRGGDLVVENSIRFNKLDGANATGDMFIGMSSSSAPRGDGIFIGGTDKFKMHGSHATNNMELHQTGAADIEINAFSGEVQLAGSSITTSTSIKLQAALLSNQENTSVGTGTGTVANVAIATYTAAFFDFVIKLGTNVRSGTVRACHDGTNIEFTEISTADLGDTSDITLYMDISGGNMRLLAANSGPNTWSIKTLTKAI